MNRIIFICGPGGVGKTTTSDALSKLYPGEFRESVSCTTRQIRPGEIDHVHYHFLTNDEFMKRVRNNEFVEYNRFANGYLYGTLYSEIEKTLKTSNCILIIDVETAAKLQRQDFFKAYNAISIFLDLDEQLIKKRLKMRGASSDEISIRLEVARAEREKGIYLDKMIDASLSPEELAKEIYNIIQG